MEENNMSELNLLELFGGMGEDLFEGFGEAPKKEEKKVEKKTEKKAEKPKEKKAAPKKNKAKETKLTFPVLVRGRSFAIKLTGEGEVDVQALVEKLVNSAHLDELKHKKARFAKIDDNTLQVVFDNLVATDSNISVSLPVVLCDGQLKAEYTENTQLEVEEDAEPSVAELVKAGLSDESREGLLVDYDATSGVAVPVYQVLLEKDAGQTIKAGDTLLVGGEVKVVENTSSLIPDYLGEIPDGWGIEYKKLKDGCYYLGLKPQGKVFSELISIDRTPFGVTEEKKAEPVKEMINLPVDIETIMPRGKVTMEPKDFDGKEKVPFDDVVEKLRVAMPIIGKEKKVSDHVYQADKNLLEVSFASGRKGSV